MSYREEFDMYGVPEPAEPWAYDLDDYGILYGPGDWPFYRFIGETPGRPPTPRSISDASICLSPDSAFQSWRQARMSAYRTAEGFDLSFGWAIRPQGMGQYIACVNVRLDDSFKILNRFNFKGGALKQVRMRVEKFKAFLEKHRAARDGGEERPETAHENYNRRKNSL